MQRFVAFARRSGIVTTSRRREGMAEKKTKSRNAVITQAIAKAGGQSALAAAIGVHRQAIDRWKEVPPKYVHAVETATRIPRHVLRPDLYPKNRELLPENLERVAK